VKTKNKKKQKKIKCMRCDDLGYFMNPFDQAIPCDCKKKKYKKPDYRGFTLHIWEWNESGIPWGTSDLIQLAKKYHTPIPKKYESQR